MDNVFVLKYLDNTAEEVRADTFQFSKEAVLFYKKDSSHPTHYYQACLVKSVKPRDFVIIGHLPELNMGSNIALQ